MTTEYHLRGLTGWVCVHGRYIVPVLDYDAYCRTVALLGEPGLLFGFDAYVFEQDGWFLGLSFCGSEVIQIALTYDDVDQVAALGAFKMSAKLIFELAVEVESANNEKRPKNLDWPRTTDIKLGSRRPPQECSLEVRSPRWKL